MATITVRGLDDDIRDKLRKRAADHGHSMEAEVRAILAAAVDRPPQYGLGTRIAARFADLDMSDFEIPPRTGMPRGAHLG